MQINHNIRAMVSQHALFQNNNAMSKSLEKLSTGLRINRAQDDAAGLAMSEQMRTQIRGLGKAKQNTQDGIAALQIAEGGLAEITNIMQRQRELAVQSATDTLTSTERKYLNDEFQELTKEIKRISETTDYNGKNMLNYVANADTGFANSEVSFGAVGAIATKGVITDEIVNRYKALADILDNFGYLHADDDNADAEYISVLDKREEFVKDDGSLEVIETFKYVRNPNVRYNQDNTTGALQGTYVATDGHLKDAADAFNELVNLYRDLRETIEGRDADTKKNEAVPAANAVSKDDIWDAKGDIEDAVDAVVANLYKIEKIFKLDANSFATDDQGTTAPTQAGDTTTLDDNKLIEDAVKVKNVQDSVVFGHLRDALLDLQEITKVVEGRDVLQNVGDKAASEILHVGANYSRGIGGKNANEMHVTYLAVDVKSLKLERQDITEQQSAGAAIDQLDRVIKDISGSRAKIGTYINRLDYTANNIANLEYNTQDAESRIRDTNFATETTDFTKNQILVQSATSILAQANSLPQSVLALIG